MKGYSCVFSKTGEKTEIYERKDHFVLGEWVLPKLSEDIIWICDDDRVLWERSVREINIILYKFFFFV